MFKIQKRERQTQTNKGRQSQAGRQTEKNKKFDKEDNQHMKNSEDSQPLNKKIRKIIV